MLRRLRYRSLLPSTMIVFNLNEPSLAAQWHPLSLLYLVPLSVGPTPSRRARQPTASAIGRRRRRDKDGDDGPDECGDKEGRGELSTDVWPAKEGHRGAEHRCDEEGRYE